FDGDMGFKVDRFYNYLYFSLTTLTTTGFGDIVPTSAFTKMLSAMEGVIGSMYIAVVVARLVGLHIVSKRTH
ncbi:MAG: two pore domain potassium channel family protein, partial [Deltaproteobacteria bacterium]|nr:two pore domain potassium channel family protein [Deltaproteobacteria bacterium]